MTTRHQLNIQPIYFEMIQSGMKIVEGRIAKPKYELFQVGDTLIFKANENSLETKIIELKHFSTFHEMLNYYGVHACLPNIKTIDAAIKVYHSFAQYDLDEGRLGVIGIRFTI